MRDLAIVATNGPQTVGGLAAYARCLGEEMQKTWRVQHVVRFAERGRPGTSYAEHERARDISGSASVRVIAPSKAWQPALRSLPRVIGRPALAPYGARLFAVSIRRSLDDAIGLSTDVIHVVGAGWELLGTAAAAVARARGVPFTILPGIHPRMWGDGDLDAALYRMADAVFVLSEVERARVVALGVRADRVVRSPLAPAISAQGDGERFRAAHGLAEALVVLFVGRKDETKGYPALLSALESLRREVPGATIVTIGAGPLIRSPGVLDLGAADGVVTADAFAACDVFCLPSSAEAFGIVYTEAWSYGKPVVGGPAPAVVELIRDGEDGIVVSQEPASIASALARLAADPELRRRLGRSGQQRQRAEFSWPAVAAAHRPAFERLATLRGA